MVVVTEHPRYGLVLAEAGFGDHVRVRFRARRLDQALAAGRNPAATTALALRADAITRPAMRRTLARSLERILAEAVRPVGLRPSPLARQRRGVVSAAADDLEALITRLLGPGPVAARGVALVITLLSDGAGPLHLGTTEPDLCTAARQALAQLDAPLAGAAAG
jgi:hypothetical protein